MFRFLRKETKEHYTQSLKNEKKKSSKYYVRNGRLKHSSEI